MDFALLTALCWAIGGFGSSRIARHYGPARANGTRLTLASLILAGIAISVTGGLSLVQAPLFALSGVLHLALGDIGLFGAYRRLGPRMGVLMVCSLAPPTALAGEWLLMGTTLSAAQLGCAAAILIAVVLAVAPRERAHLSPKELRMGLICGLVAAVGQGLGAALNRYAYFLLEPAEVSAWLPAWYRVAGGALGVWIWVGGGTVIGQNPLARPQELIPHKKVAGHPWMWMGVSTILGPVIGMMFLMKAFASTPSGLVQATLSTLPVLMIPVAWILDGNRPSLRSVGFGLVAVALTAWLAVMG